jgi:hypothetical protein
MTTMADPNNTKARPRSHSHQRSAPVKASADVVTVDEAAGEVVLAKLGELVGEAPLAVPELPEPVDAVDVGAVTTPGWATT